MICRGRTPPDPGRFGLRLPPGCLERGCHRAANDARCTGDHEGSSYWVPRRCRRSDPGVRPGTRQGGQRRPLSACAAFHLSSRLGRMDGGPEANPSVKAWKRTCEDVASGLVWNQTFLDRSEHPDFPTEVRVVDFHDVFTVPREVWNCSLPSGQRRGCAYGRRIANTCRKHSRDSSCGWACPKPLLRPGNAVQHRVSKRFHE